MKPVTLGALLSRSSEPTDLKWRTQVYDVMQRPSECYDRLVEGPRLRFPRVNVIRPMLVCNLPEAFK